MTEEYREVTVSYKHLRVIWTRNGFWNADGACWTVKGIKGLRKVVWGPRSLPGLFPATTDRELLALTAVHLIHHQQGWKRQVKDRLSVLANPDFRLLGEEIKQCLKLTATIRTDNGTTIVPYTVNECSVHASNGKGFLADLTGFDCAM